MENKLSVTKVTFYSQKKVKTNFPTLLVLLESTRSPLSQRHVDDNSEGMATKAIFWEQYKNGHKPCNDGQKTSNVYVEDTQDTCMQPVLQDDAISGDILKF